MAGRKMDHTKVNRKKAIMREKRVKMQQQRYADMDGELPPDVELAQIEKRRQERKGSELSVGYWWENFNANVVPPSAGDIQRREMRNAFFAGAAAYSSIINEIATIEDEAECEAKMSDLIQEMSDFIEGLGFQILLGAGQRGPSA